MDSAFAYYSLLASRSLLQALGKGSTFMELTPTDLGSHQVPLPPPAEQQTIAAFLDHESAQIDSLIAKNHQLIERLAEYRTALITRTVTRGLPPDAAEAAGLNPKPALKPSGVEWLGDVPEHWEVLTNRRMFCERDERSDDGEGELLTVSHITGVTRRSEKPDVGMFMAESLEDYKCCSTGDFVINTMWAWMGAAGTAREPGLVSPSYNVYTPDRQRLLPRFVDLAYRSSRYVLGMTSESRGIWSSRLRLYPQHFLSLVTAVPPLREQEAIIAHIDAVEERFAHLNAAVCAAIERLQEYRTALITAAVTGKIDVRDREQTKAGARV
jgi:type I restriction enzyme S subunit